MNVIPLYDYSREKFNIMLKRINPSISDVDEEMELIKYQEFITNRSI